jgi:type IV pilus assembly protein PilM
LKYQDTVKKLQKLKKLTSIFRRNASIALPHDAAVSKILTIDSALTGRELEYAIYQKMESLIPFPLDSVALDYTADSGFNSHLQTFRVHIAKQEIVDDWCNVVHKLGFKSQVVATAAHALMAMHQQIIRHSPQYKNWLLLDIGYQQMTICSVMGFDVEGYKTWYLPCLKKESEPHYGVEYKSDTQLIGDAVCQKLLPQLQRYRSLSQGEKIEGILLSGGKALSEGIDSVLTKQCQLPCRLLSPNKLINCPARNNLPLSESYVTAIGIALLGAHWIQEVGDERC